MRVAIPTNDRETIFPRTGKAKQFAIYDIDNKSVLFVEFRENPHKHAEDSEESHIHSHKDMVETLKDCNALLVKMAGQHLREDFKAARVALIKTEDTQLQCIANSYAKSPETHPEI